MPFDLPGSALSPGLAGSWARALNYRDFQDKSLRVIQYGSRGVAFYLLRSRPESKLGLKLFNLCAAKPYPRQTEPAYLLRCSPQPARPQIQRFVSFAQGVSMLPLCRRPPSGMGEFYRLAAATCQNRKPAGSPFCWAHGRAHLLGQYVFLQPSHSGGQALPCAACCVRKLRASCRTGASRSPEFTVVEVRSRFMLPLPSPSHTLFTLLLILPCAVHLTNRLPANSPTATMRRICTRKITGPCRTLQGCWLLG